ncbi:WD repeat protein, variant 2 [Blastomyces dermatitidis ER-3]|uniref:WD repeat protein n=1 Tax=Ajellomyces dermatitidis (strain ER-3 / ATCC MYA-2586) TaxID=559297 RepID=A0ABP2ERM8_AJEDR|nr:WD repeat protein [Blastomyces dermatitidis ER-3]XP_045282362.1 WD repeat protein, variant 1 [Blastomyces dermatitidis ER-3]XP_045282363.1 WD repeat protein, variant 2 [Blastomyces dermatitidis ER-3]EEQ84651.1 WD repeat protein [Blastomyces dermatitidis ER-3]OAT02635.1 WD repeat protein, variant 1 [Blastomyces dermatitidis ER-3]OAT02636.1 WD repeat protein, variant 2 [Blastomyces dermatitidis ER-3]
MTDPSLPDGNKQENPSNRSTSMDQQEAHSNPDRGSLPGEVQGEMAAFSPDGDSRSLNGPVSLSSLPHSLNSPLRPTDHDTHEVSYSLDQALSSPFAPQQGPQQATSDSQTSGSQPDQLSTSSQTSPLLDSFSPPAGIENETADDIFPVSSVTNAAGQPIFSLQIGTASFFTEEGDSMVSASITHLTNGSTGPIYPEDFPHALESTDDDEMDSLSGDQDLHYDYGYYDDEENPAFRSNLIEESELSRFSDDRLPGVSSALGSTGSVYDDSCSENDTEKFYITDDELSWCDPTEYSNTRSPLGNDLHDSGSHQDQLPTFATGGHSQPLSFTTFDNINGSNFTFNPEADDDDNLDLGAFTQPETFEKNLSIDMFIKQWLIRSKIPPQQLALKDRPHVPISDAAANASYWPRPQRITRPENHQFKAYDIQKIPWQKKMNVRRSDARILRDSWYKGYRNLVFDPHGYSKRLPQTEEFFKAKTMYTKYKASMSHFQLRNLMSVTSSNTVQYAHRSKIYSVTPFHKQKNCLIDLSHTSKSATFFEPVRISIMKAKHGVTIVGGFCGEYAMRGDVTDHSTVDGYITKSQNGITNHIDIAKHRTSRSPQAIIASNDQYLRVLDCETNKVVQRHKFARAINCTDTSLDGRLRVIVGDAREAWIIDSECGKPVQPLSGHQDFGFACAWSPDMLHVATSNQDGTVNIWDARMWRILQFIESDVAGYRSLRYSPVGGGPRTLLMCEPADRIAIVNAQTYQTRQVHDFFGEIGGADYTPDGGRIWVANMDYAFGGLMEFDRCQWGQEFGIGRTRKRHIEERLDTYYPDLPNEWLPEADLDDDERCVLGPGERKLRYRRLMSNREHADLLRL